MNDRNTNPSQIRDDLLFAEFGHELGNVLNGLLGMTQLVRSSPLTAEQDRWLYAIEQSGQQLRRLVDAFRAGPRQQYRAWRPTPLPIDGIELLEQAILCHAPAARENGNRLLLTLDPELPRRWNADPRLLRQVLDNLLGNALKFTREGEVILEARAETEGTRASGTVLLSVVDSGPGIGPESARRIFGAFERGREHRNAGGRGRGLGLFICRQIMQALGGEIRWVSPAGGGTRFVATFPGMLAGSAAYTAIPSRLLGSVDCCVDLQGALRRSITSTLTRLGVPWRLSGEEGKVVRDAVVSDVRGGPLRVSVREIPASGRRAGARLQLRAKAAAGPMAATRTMEVPVFESSLGPILLELVLESLWFRNDRQGSACRPPRSVPRDDRGSPRA